MAKLKVGMIGGGGPGNFFGGVHKRAISLDATRELVAGALRSKPRQALNAAKELDIQGYPDYQSMLDACSKGDLELDYVTIVTPNDAHYAPAKAFLQAGIPVLCEKPITMTLDEARDLARIVKRKKVPFVLAHTYTGFPLMMLAKEFISQGKIGEVRKIEAWYNQGWLATPLEKSGQQQAAWRTDPKRTGISNCGGDIGTHAFVAATWTSGLEVKRVSSRLNTFVKGRVLDDDFNVIAELSNGGTALIWPNVNVQPHRILLWHPHGVGQTESWRLYPIDKNAPKLVKDAQRRYMMRYGGPTGVTESDDMENWNYAFPASLGTIAQRLPYNFTMGLGHDYKDDRMPGMTFNYRIAEENQRSRLRRWVEFMEASSWDDIYPLNAKKNTDR